MFLLVYVAKGSQRGKSLETLDAALRAAHDMMAKREGAPLEIRKDGKLLLATAALHERLRQYAD